ncbi:MAG: hypothetical protein KVP17_003857 [Porospora cf. gigantea B]|uniref:uncharacterized protein n=1 Tax=Porospora cf. gigantea B TaxID=2853592 RepID=UPI003571A92D|nr:MAG: hypothetical protein KVP17_003857 [Porospora cf. gigantea B]
MSNTNAVKLSRGGLRATKPDAKQDPLDQTTFGEDVMDYLKGTPEWLSSGVNDRYEVGYTPLSSGRPRPTTRREKRGDRVKAAMAKIPTAPLEIDDIEMHPLSDKLLVNSYRPVLRVQPVHGVSPPSDASDALSQAGSANSEGGGKGLWRVLTEKWYVTILLLFIPLGVAAKWLDWPSTTIFWLNFIAILPQAWLMGKCTEDMAAEAGQITGGLLNAWFGNVVEMLLCFAGLRQGELVIVRSTLVGSILSNLLLVCGCSFFFGGIKHKVQEFSAIGASTNASLMTLSCMCIGLPTVYAAILSSAQESELQISRAVSIFLIIIYGQYMFFQLWTHSFLFEDDDEEEPDLHWATAAAILGFCTVCCAINSEYLVGSVEGVVASANLSKEFVGIILLPIIGNAAEHYTSIMVAMKNKMDLSISCAVGSSCQMALFVTPFTVLAGWAMGQPMGLDLHAFEILVLLLSVLIVTSILQDGYSNWLEGSMLCSAYLVVAIIYFFEDPKFSEII